MKFSMFFHFYVLNLICKSMKKSTLLFLLLTHLLSSIGYSMSIHECAGQKEYIIYGLGIGHSCTCSHINTGHKNKCCKEKNIVVKNDKKDKISNKDYVFKKNDIAIKELIYSKALNPISINHSYTIQNIFPLSHAPPLFILYNVFRI